MVPNEKQTTNKQTNKQQQQQQKDHGWINKDFAIWSHFHNADNIFFGDEDTYLCTFLSKFPIKLMHTETDHSDWKDRFIVHQYI